jgi:hypothetical protein
MDTCNVFCALVVCVAPAVFASPATAQTGASGKWEIEFHGGGMLSGKPTGGTVSLPGPGEEFTSITNVPALVDYSLSRAVATVNVENQARRNDKTHEEKRETDQQQQRFDWHRGLGQMSRWAHEQTAMIRGPDYSQRTTSATTLERLMSWIGSSGLSGVCATR